MGVPPNLPQVPADAPALWIVGVDRSQDRRVLERISQKCGNSQIPHSPESLVWCSTQLLHVLSCWGKPSSATSWRSLQRLSWNLRWPAFLREAYFACQMRLNIIFIFFLKLWTPVFLTHTAVSVLSLGLTCLSAPSSFRFIPVGLHLSYKWEGRLVAVAFAWKQELLFSSKNNWLEGKMS